MLFTKIDSGGRNVSVWMRTSLSTKLTDVVTKYLKIILLKTVINNKKPCAL